MKIKLVKYFSSMQFNLICWSFKYAVAFHNDWLCLTESWCWSISLLKEPWCIKFKISFIKQSISHCEILVILTTINFMYNRIKTTCYIISMCSRLISNSFKSQFCMNCVKRNAVQSHPVYRYSNSKFHVISCLSFFSLNALIFLRSLIVKRTVWQKALCGSVLMTDKEKK